MIPVLLTATVDPKGMQGASFSVEDRVQMYVEAVRFYVSKGMSVVFAENSGQVEQVRKALPDTDVEWLDVSGSEYDQSRGKGYNETLLIKKAVELSKRIQESGHFFKVTGRLKVLNIERLIAECNQLSFKADCKDHNLYELLHMPINGHAGECRYWFATADFFMTQMMPHLESMNDYTEPPFLAEDAMLAVCREVRGTKACRDRFRTQARISGRGGHDLGKGLSFFYSTDNDSLALKLKCGIRQVIRWTLPGLRL